MSVWLVRAGQHGEQEQRALDHGFVTIGWNELPDLSTVGSREDIRKIYEEKYPNNKEMRTVNHVAQIWAF